MKTIKAIFDGEKVVLPDDLEHLEPCEVILIFGAGQELPWLRAQEEALASVWDNDEDATYDSM